MLLSLDSNTVGAYEAKTHLAELLEKVAAGEEITITRHGTAVAKLVPVKRKATVEQRALAIARIQRLSQTVRLGGLRIKDLISEGRK